MIIRYASDLHIDLNTELFDLTEVDIMQRLNLYNINLLILAGDTAEYPNNLKFCDMVLRMYPELKIIEVGGNHLYYSGKRDKISISEINKECKKFARKHDRYFFLENNTVTIDNIKFIGCTLWSDLSHLRLSESVLIYSQMNDYRKILNDDLSTLKTSDSSLIFEKSSRFILREVNKTPEDKECIVITHHAPFLIHKDTLSYCFGTNLHDLIRKFKKIPLAWIYGHTHYNPHGARWFDTKFEDNELMCVCNQMGYNCECDLDSIPFDNISILDV